VLADDRTGTVTVRLRRPDPQLLFKLALPFAYPVPREAPMGRLALLGVPGTGPYLIRRVEASKVVLVRNPSFREWSAAAQPSGYPDRIEVTYDIHLGRQLTAVERGRFDLMQSLPAARLNEILTRYAAQVHTFLNAQTAAIFLNTKLPPFDEPAVREAFSLAIDRRKAVAAYGGAQGASITCQILPAGMPGYRPYCPSTRSVNRKGVWIGPDRARAERLVAASGTKGQKVTVWTRSVGPQLLVGQLAAATLRELGYVVKLEEVPGKPGAYFNKISDSRTKVQAGFDAWTADYAAASNFFTPIFTCGSFEPANPENDNVAQLCDPGVDRAVGSALAREATDPRTASDGTWAAVDRLVTDTNAWVPIVNPHEAVFVSKRVGNVQSNTQWGVLIDQLWVR
jgi:peptide/nickel transport system substrate-binding protein